MGDKLKINEGLDGGISGSHTQYMLGKMVAGQLTGASNALFLNLFITTGSFFSCEESHFNLGLGRLDWIGRLDIVLSLEHNCKMLIDQLAKSRPT